MVIYDRAFVGVPVTGFVGGDPNMRSSTSGRKTTGLSYASAATSGRKTTGVADDVKDDISERQILEDEASKWACSKILLCPQCRGVVPSGFLVCLHCQASLRFGTEVSSPAMTTVRASMSVEDAKTKAERLARAVRFRGRVANRTMQAEYWRYIKETMKWRRVWKTMSLEAVRDRARKGQFPNFPGTFKDVTPWLPDSPDDILPDDEVIELVAKDDADRHKYK